MSQDKRRWQKVSGGHDKRFYPKREVLAKATDLIISAGLNITGVRCLTRLAADGLYLSKGDKKRVLRLRECFYFKRVGLEYPSALG
ncbi:hypothetical protein CFF01_11355 [Shewanella marisflavi]|uniref:Uncharacterized protein n=1 Tax=Shewanella marisflavi TaxID=260364 RepID=A0AAC9XNV5_9GAMM|nr:hypothetical protein CFF01_11355 [Shewanella marisflavi]